MKVFKDKKKLFLSLIIFIFILTINLFIRGIVELNIIKREYLILASLIFSLILFWVFYNILKKILKKYNLTSIDISKYFKDKSEHTSLINKMTNSYFHFKSIEDENGYIYDGILIELNEAGAEFLEIDKEKSIGMKMSELYLDFNLYKEDITRVVNKTKVSKSESFLHDINFIDSKWGNLSIYSITPGYFYIIINDISKIKKYSQQMKYIASYDELTGLLNRRSIFEYINKLIKEDKPFAVYSIDLDNFRGINKILGYESGDEVLKVIGSKLNILSGKSVKAARIWADEFIIVKQGDDNEEASKSFIDSIFNILNEEYKLELYRFKLNLSIGVSYFPIHSKDPSILIKYSNLSMEIAKKHFGNRYEIFSDIVLRDLTLEEELTDAIDNNQLEVYYQPIYDLKTNQIVEAEALVRWIKSDRVISPFEFIPIAKKNGEIIRIDKFVFRDSARYCKKIIDSGLKDFKISVNLSNAFLKQSYIIDLLSSIVEEEGITPKSIKLEITEDETIEDMKYAIDILTRLREKGFSISLDDFGVGYSSFNHLKKLPIDTLKIDRSLLLSIENDKKTISIIGMIIKLGHTLKLDIVCEGVEEKEQITLLEDLNCDKIQGYYISRPVKALEFNKIIEEYNKIIIS